MSKSIKLIAAFGFIAAISACTSGQTDEEFVVVDPSPSRLSRHTPANTSKTSSGQAFAPALNTALVIGRDV